MLYPSLLISCLLTTRDRFAGEPWKPLACLRSSRSRYPKVQVNSKEEEMCNSDKATTLDWIVHTLQKVVKKRGGFWTMSTVSGMRSREKNSTCIHHAYLNMLIECHYLSTLSSHHLYPYPRSDPSPVLLSVDSSIFAPGCASVSLWQPLA